MRQLISILLIFTAFTGIVNAQSKSEIKLYKKILDTKSTKNINKFLRKYPESTYYASILKMRDSIAFFKIKEGDLNSFIKFSSENPNSFYSTLANQKINELTKSSISSDEAINNLVSAGVDKNNILSSTCVKYNNEEAIFAILSPNNEKTSYEIVKIDKLSGSWKIADLIKENIYKNSAELDIFELVESPEFVIVGGKPFLFYSYVNKTRKAVNRSSIASNSIEYVANLYSITDKSVVSNMFNGKTEFGTNNTTTIYGSSTDMSQINKDTPAEIIFLSNKLKNNSNLKPYKEGNFADQELVEWWYNNNPDRTSQLKFVKIPDTSKIIEAYKKSKEKVNAGNYTVSYFTLYKTVMVVVYDKKDKDYSLAYCLKAPVARKDKMLNNIYSKGNVISLYFYEDNSLTKKKINLVNKKVF